MNKLIQFSYIFVITLTMLMSTGRNIVGFLHIKMLAMFCGNLIQNEFSLHTSKPIRNLTSTYKFCRDTHDDDDDDDDDNELFCGIVD